MRGRLTFSFRKADGLVLEVVRFPWAVEPLPVRYVSILTYPFNEEGTTHVAARILAAKIGDIPDGEAIIVTKEVAGTVDDIALFHDGGEYFALDNTCSHELASLADGWVEGGTVECPLHTGKFCLRDGKVLSSPADRDVAAHEVEVEGDDIVVLPNTERLA